MIKLEETTTKNITIKEAAREMGKTEQFIRIGLQRGLLEFGTAQVMPGSNKYTYYISPNLFFKALGKEVPEKYQEKKIKTAEELGVITDPAIARNLSWNWR